MSEPSKEPGSQRVQFGDIVTLQSVLALALGLVAIFVSDAVGSPAWVKLLLKDVGFALLVAVFVWGFFEVAYRQKQDVRLDERIERITKNVFFGVFRRDLPGALIDEASMLVLEAKIVREKFSVHYTLSDGNYQGADGSQHPFVRLRAVSSFVLRNVTRETVNVPIGVRIPNPIDPGLRAESNVISIKVTDRPSANERELDLTHALEKMRREMSDDRALLCRCIPEILELRRGQRVRVAMEYVMAKETEDTEVLQSRYPSDGLKLIVIDTAPSKRIVRARSIHRENLIDDSSPDEPGTNIYTLDNHLLPFQGAIVWWKNRIPSGGEGVEAEGGSRVNSSV